MAPSRHWRDLTIAIVGGDAREAEIARLAAETGATTRAFGFPWPETDIPGVTLAGSARDVLAGADIALFPIAGIKDECLYAPSLRDPIRVDAALLAGMATGGHIVCGSADAALTREAAARSLTIHTYEHDQESRLLRMPSVVEGVLAALIANTTRSLHGSEIAVLGQGPLGRLLALALHRLGASVHAIARDPIQRAEAVTQGIDACSFES